ncbi:hypothetical protein TIFTF001_013422 [Ficus carica]|uniref:TF-B3 domain-containing protein n=1 Tax=Ficus carica TaxID=3494 RepID=A0AA88AE86_FICCA|nr:hypothetical protein TIFTF001_013422 [Ficus carica]
MAPLDDPLMIPLKSSMIPGGDLSEAATLADPNGEAWRVRLNRCAEHIWLCDGLKEFITRSITLRLFNSHTKGIHHFVFAYSMRWDPRLTPPAMIQSVMTSIMKAKEIMIQTKGRPPKHSRDGASVARRAMTLGKKSTSNFRFKNGNQKWPVRYYSDRRGVSSSFKRISTGWGSFSSENNLVEGDVCVFELINKEENNNLLRVWIYRAADYAVPVGKRFKAK